MRRRRPEASSQPWPRRRRLHQLAAAAAAATAATTVTKGMAPARVARAPLEPLQGEPAWSRGQLNIQLDERMEDLHHLPCTEQVCMAVAAVRCNALLSVGALKGLWIQHTSIEHGEVCHKSCKPALGTAD